MLHNLSCTDGVGSHFSPFYNLLISVKAALKSEYYMCNTCHSLPCTNGFSFFSVYNFLILVKVREALTL